MIVLFILFFLTCVFYQSRKSISKRLSFGQKPRLSVELRLLMIILISRLESFVLYIYIYIFELLKDLCVFFLFQPSFAYVCVCVCVRVFVIVFKNLLRSARTINIHLFIPPFIVPGFFFRCECVCVCV